MRSTETSTIDDPVIRYNAFADSSINFDVILRVGAYVDQFLVRHEFIKHLHRRYNHEGIIIPFPIRTLHTSADVAVSQADRQGDGDGPLAGIEAISGEMER